jgi:hypothetical protein
VSGVDLYWLPLGAGGHFVRLNGIVYEAIAARFARRPACDLYHSALVVSVPEGALASSVPTPVWGRDELHAGEMWNSNSVISWLLMRSGLGTDGIRPPRGGRAPGWDAGLAVAGRA